MKEISIEQILEQVKSGELDMVSALAKLSSAECIRDIGFAKIDCNRHARCGFPEFIYGEGKTAEQIIQIIKVLLNRKNPVLVTRLKAEDATAVCSVYPQGEYDSQARTFVIRDGEINKTPGKVLIVSAGTSDLKVALESKYTAELSGCEVDFVPDAGVAGIHRLFAHSDKLRSANVIIAVAGMEGALPSVIGGLVSCPVIAVPTSVGYGASLGGFTAMFAMLNSCSNGITVVNIDNGFGAGCAAARILKSLSK